MSTQLDEKRHPIINILEELRSFNAEIGYYEASIMNQDFNYSIKLNNGNITIVDELVNDYERARSNITKDRYEAASKKFISSNPIKVSELKENEVKESVQKDSSRSFILGFIIILIIVAVILFFILK